MQKIAKNLFFITGIYVAALGGIILSTIFVFFILGITSTSSKVHWFNQLSINIRFLTLYIIWFGGAFLSALVFCKILKNTMSLVNLTIISSISFLLWILLFKILETSWLVN